MTDGIAYEETPLTHAKSKKAKPQTASPRKIVKDTRRAAIKELSVSEFLWVKTVQHRYGLIVAVFIAENGWLLWDKILRPLFF